MSAAPSKSRDGAGRLAGIARRSGKRAAMEELERTVITPESGVVGDSRGRPGIRQVTVLSAESWARALADLAGDLPWTTRRANLLVRGVELPRRAGAVLIIGSVRLEVTRETDPCSRMDEQCAGLTAALTPDWRGGVCCRVLNGGRVGIGDAVRVEWPDAPSEPPASGGDPDATGVVV